MYLLDNPEIGNSLYEHHADGSGVHFSSRLRPILNLKPKTLTWSFNADTNLTAWLKAIDQPFDIITDEQLHYEGIDLLDDYRVVISGTHPEYHSTDMLDAITAWMDQGGAVFSTGSISYTGALSFNDYKNDIATITKNVLNRFLDPSRFDYPPQGDWRDPDNTHASG